VQPAAVETRFAAGGVFDECLIANARFEPCGGDWKRALACYRELKETLSYSI
jgi:hypothetical protein